MSTIGCTNNEIAVYDSLQLRPNLYTQLRISCYLSLSFKIKVANVATQKGRTDCGLYVIAMMTSLAYNENSVHLMYNQQDMRIHLEQCFEKGMILDNLSQFINNCTIVLLPAISPYSLSALFCLLYTPCNPVY